MHDREEKAAELQAFCLFVDWHSSHTALQQRPVVGGEEGVWQLPEKLLENAGHIVRVAVRRKGGSRTVQQVLKKGYKVK